MHVLDVLSDTSDRPRWVLGGITALLVLLCAGGSALLYQRSLHRPVTVAGIILGQTRIPAMPFEELDGAVSREARRQLESNFTLEYGTQTIRITPRDLGARVSHAETRTQLRQIGKTGHVLQDLMERISARRGKLVVPLAVYLDRDVALSYFTRLKEDIDRAPIPLRLDLERQRVRPGAHGYRLQVYDSMVAVELALRGNQSSAKLAVVVLDPGARSKGLDNLDISHVLGQFSTVYSLADKDRDRAHNLKVGASKIDGTILRPKERFSFNEVVGRRTEMEGYRTAPVITEGELVDGMAGGACQLSSTLFAASFFAGLDLLSSRPHTMPSSYIKMGLDAAVAYPGTDLVLSNPYPFPVVIHFVVNSGKARVRILGRKRPWRRIVFEREVQEEISFETVERKDPNIPRGQEVVVQRGVPGFKLERRRLFFGKGAEPEQVEKRELRYPPTTQYVHQGTGPPDPEWKPPKAKEPFGQVKPQFSMEQ